MNPNSSIKAPPNYIGLLWNAFSYFVFFFVFFKSDRSLGSFFTALPDFLLFLLVFSLCIVLPTTLLFFIKGIEIDYDEIQVYYPFRLKTYTYLRKDIKTVSITKHYYHIEFEQVKIKFNQGNTLNFTSKAIVGYKDIKHILSQYISSADKNSKN